MVHLPKQILVVVAIVSILCVRVHAADLQLPQQISKDLVIESIEQGEFLTDPPDPRQFKITSLLTKNTGLFGWRIKVKTNKTSIQIQEKGTKADESNGLPMRLTPKYGYLFSGTETQAMLPAGKYTFRMCVENVPIKTLTMTIK